MSSIIIIPGGCTASGYTTDYAFANYGDIADNTPKPYASFHVNFTVPIDGYVKYASMGLNTVESSDVSYTIRNLDTSTSLSTLTLTAGSRYTYSTLADNAFTFSAGDRLQWTSNDTVTATSTNITTFCKLTNNTNSYLNIRGSARQDFNSGNTPFSYGSGSYDYSISVENQFLQKVIPVKCYFVAASISANESGSALTSDFTLEFYRNNNLIGDITLTSGNLSIADSSSYFNIFNPGALFGVKMGTTNPNVTFCSFTALFSINTA